MVDIPCIAPLVKPPAIANASLLALFLMTRHGARTPTWQWEKDPARMGIWECGNRHRLPRHRVPIVNGVRSEYPFNATETYRFKPSCSEGSLLDEGFDQQEALGRLYREYLVDDTKLLPGKFDPQRVRIRSSYSQRCIESALGFMQGLYEPEGDNETVDMTTGKEGDEPLCPYIYASSAFKKATRKWEQTREFADRCEESDKMFAPIYETYNMNWKHDGRYFLMGDYFNVRRCQGLPIDPVNDEMLAQLVRNIAFFESGYFDYAGEIAWRPIQKLLLDAIRTSMKTQDAAKFVLISGHDVSIVALMVGLGYVDDFSPPPYASHLAVELWSLPDPHVRFVLNGEVIRFQGRETTPLDVLADMWDVQEL